MDIFRESRKGGGRERHQLVTFQTCSDCGPRSNLQSLIRNGTCDPSAPGPTLTERHWPELKITFECCVGAKMGPAQVRRIDFPALGDGLFSECSHGAATCSGSPDAGWNY